MQNLARRISLRLFFLGAMATLAGPTAALADLGKGDRFPDLVLTGEAGERLTVGSLRDQVVFLQFWGTWCPPCLSEMPSVNELWEEVGAEPGIRFLMVPISEPLEVSLEWMRDRGFELPVWHAGHYRAGDDVELADGSRLVLNQVFRNRVPQTFILDADGTVALHFVDARYDWPDRADEIRALRDAAR